MTGHSSPRLRPGDSVTWNTNQGKTHGTVEKKQTSETHIKSHKVKASAAEPQYIVKSDKSGKTAAHKPEKLKKPECYVSVAPFVWRGLAGNCPLNEGPTWRRSMPRGDKSSYTDKQDRTAAHIAESYESRGVSENETERRAWATVNKEDGGGKKSGSGVGHPVSHAPSRKGGKIGGAASASRPRADRSEAARKAAATRKRNAESLG